MVANKIINFTIILTLLYLLCSPASAEPKPQTAPAAQTPQTAPATRTEQKKARAQQQEAAAIQKKTQEKARREMQNKDRKEQKEQPEEVQQPEELSAEQQWQYLEWKEEEPEFVMKYEVIVEEYDSKTNSYSEINRILTEDNSTKVQVQPFLPPGNYRYKVITYNLIGIPEVASENMEFTIFEAHQPEIHDIKSAVNLTSTLFLEEINDGIFSVTGKNLFTEKTDSKDTTYTSYYLENRKKNSAPIIPEILETDERSRKLKIKFNLKDLDTGTYNFMASDASGLLTTKEKRNEITVKFKKRVDFDLSAGYACPVVLFDDTINEYMKTNVLPLSVTSKISFMPFKHNFGYFGTGITGTYTRMFKDHGSYKIDGNLITGNALFIYQLPIRVKPGSSEKRRHIMTLEAHGGAGLTFFNDIKFHFEHGIVSDPLNSINIDILAGGAVHIYITNRLYTEINADYIMAFVSDMEFGMIVPSASIGWQF